MMNLKPIVVRLSDIDPEPANDRRVWGEWVYDPELLTLTYGPTDYEIDLERLTTCAAMLDFIFQVGQKAWGYHHVGDLIRALSDIMDPQACLCSFQHDRGPIVPKERITLGRKTRGKHRRKTRK